MAAAGGHAPNEFVQQVSLIHAENESDIDHLVRPIATSIGDYCKLPSPVDFDTNFKADEDVGKTVVKHMTKAKNSAKKKRTDQIHAVIIISEKFLKTVCKTEDVRKAVEDLLLEDKTGKIFALLWTDVKETDIKTFSTQLFKRWQERVDFPVVQAAHYREYRDDYAALAEGVYKVWNGRGTFVERPNNLLSSREADVIGNISPRKEPVESLDPTAMTQFFPSGPTVGADGNEGLFILQDKMSSNDDNNIAAVNPLADNNSRVTEGAEHDSNPTLAVGVGDDKSLFDREDRRSSDSSGKDGNLAVGNDHVQAMETGEGKSEKVIDTDPGAAVDPDCDKDTSLPVQSDGCHNAQSAQQKSSNAPTNQDNASDEVTPTEEESKSPESASEDKNVKESENKKSTDDKSKTKEHHIKCTNPDCNSEDQVVPEDKFFTSKEPLVKDFTQDQKDELMFLLDPPAACVKDWRHLASRKGVPNKNITFWEKRVQSGTIAYLEYLARHHANYTVKEFKKDVKSISRMDVLDLLEEFTS